MYLTLKRTKEGVIPIDDKAVEAISKINIGDEFLVDYKKKRNVKNHRRLFSMLQGVVYNSDHYKNVDNLLAMLKLKTGHFDIVVSHKGEQLYIPKSIDFASMDEEEFKEFFSECIDVILEFTPEQDINSILKYA